MSLRYLGEPNDAITVYGERRSDIGAVVLEDAVLTGHLAVRPEVAQQRETEVAKIPGPLPVRVFRIAAYTQDLGIGGLELGVDPVQGRQFLPSYACPIVNVEHEDHVALAQVLGERICMLFADRHPVQTEVGGFLSDPKWFYHADSPPAVH